jgi:hypothetical protein
MVKNAGKSPGDAAQLSGNNDEEEFEKVLQQIRDLNPAGPSAIINAGDEPKQKVAEITEIVPGSGEQDKAPVDQLLTPKSPIEEIEKIMNEAQEELLSAKKISESPLSKSIGANSPIEEFDQLAQETGLLRPGIEEQINKTIQDIEQEAKSKDSYRQEIPQIQIPANIEGKSLEELMAELDQEVKNLPPSSELNSTIEGIKNDITASKGSLDQGRTVEKQQSPLPEVMNTFRLSDEQWEESRQKLVKEFGGDNMIEITKQIDASNNTSKVILNVDTRLQEIDQELESIDKQSKLLDEKYQALTKREAESGISNNATKNDEANNNNITNVASQDTNIEKASVNKDQAPENTKELAAKEALKELNDIFANSVSRSKDIKTLEAVSSKIDGLRKLVQEDNNGIKDELLKQYYKDSVIKSKPDLGEAYLKDLQTKIRSEVLDNKNPELFEKLAEQYQEGDNLTKAENQRVPYSNLNDEQKRGVRDKTTELLNTDNPTGETLKGINKRILTEYDKIEKQDQYDSLSNSEKQKVRENFEGILDAAELDVKTDIKFVNAKGSEQKPTQKPSFTSRLSSFFSKNDKTESRNLEQQTEALEDNLTKNRSFIDKLKAKIFKPKREEPVIELGNADNGIESPPKTPNPPTGRKRSI